MTTKVVYTESSDTISIVVNEIVFDDISQEDKLIPISFVTNSTSKIEISFSDQVKDSINNPDMISFNDNGEISLNLNMLTSVVKNRAHEVVIKAFDAGHPLGQTIVAPYREESNLSLIFK